MNFDLFVVSTFRVRQLFFDILKCRIAVLLANYRVDVLVLLPIASTKSFSCLLQNTLCENSSLLFGTCGDKETTSAKKSIGVFASTFCCACH